MSFAATRFVRFYRGFVNHFHVAWLASLYKRATRAHFTSRVLDFAATPPDVWKWLRPSDSATLKIGAPPRKWGIAPKSKDVITAGQSRRRTSGGKAADVLRAVMAVVCATLCCWTGVSLATGGYEESGKPILNRDWPLLFASSQGPNLDYSRFLHASQRHASLACTSCHVRSDNAATPRFPGHKACFDCHVTQFTTAAIPMCAICHADINSSNPPLKSFPSRFNESFNVKFDHVQHNSGAGRPANGCNACHARLGRRTAPLSIPIGLSAHNQCYTCHTPSSKNNAGREMASCGVCHDSRPYSRTAVNARAYRYAFSHAKHGGAQRLDCADCHRLSAGAPQSRQVSSPFAAEHFPLSRGMTCLTCHNGKRSFGGDLAFKDCRRCHSAATFRMPM